MAKTLKKNLRKSLRKKSRNKQFNKKLVRKSRSIKKHISRIKRHKLKKRLSRKMRGGGDTVESIIHVIDHPIKTDTKFVLQLNATKESTHETVLYKAFEITGIKKIKSGQIKFKTILQELRFTENDNFDDFKINIRKKLMPLTYGTHLSSNNIDDIIDGIKKYFQFLNFVSD